MPRENIQNEFLNLRLQGFSLPKIAESLGISLITAKRWNKILSANISRDDESVSLRKKIIEKQKEYFEFLDNTFLSIKSEILKYDAPRMPYDKLIVSAMKILNAINKMNPASPSFSEKLLAYFGDTECEDDTRNDIIKDEDEARNDIIKDDDNSQNEIQCDKQNDTVLDTNGIKTQIPYNQVHIAPKRKNDTVMIPKK